MGQGTFLDEISRCPRSKKYVCAGVGIFVLYTVGVLPNTKGLTCCKSQRGFEKGLKKLGSLMEVGRNGFYRTGINLAYGVKGEKREILAVVRYYARA